jgi:predicted dehydrogenase
VKAVRANHRIWQTGSWQRSERHFHYACEIVRNGLLGRITRVEVGLPGGHTDFAGTGEPLLQKLAQLPEKVTDLAKVVPGTPAWSAAVSQPPPELDFATWIGPSKTEPYIEARVHKNWRWNYNTGGGQLLDWIGHHCDIAHWGLGGDDTIGPMEIEGAGDFPAPNALWNTSPRYRVTAKYPNDITMIIAGGHPDIRSGTKWIGTAGWVWVDRGHFEASNEEWRDYRRLPDELRKVKLPISNNHHRNFLDSVKSRQPTIAPVETAHHSAIPGHLGLISMLVGRRLKWDARKEKILGDADASKLLSRPYRAPWQIAGYAG